MSRPRSVQALNASRVSCSRAFGRPFDITSRCRHTIPLPANLAFRVLHAIRNDSMNVGRRLRSVASCASDVEGRDLSSYLRSAYCQSLQGCPSGLDHGAGLEEPTCNALSAALRRSAFLRLASEDKFESSFANSVALILRMMIIQAATMGDIMVDCGSSRSAAWSMSCP